MPVRKPAEARREEIVETALDLIDQAGLPGASTTAIAARIGLSQAAVFRHFPKKDDLLLAVVDTLAGRLLAGLHEAIDPEAPSLDQLRAAVDCLLRTVRRTPAMPAILFSRELLFENATLRAAVFLRIGRAQAMFASIIGACVAAKTFRGDIDVDRTAFMIIGLMQGLVVRWSLSDRRLDLTEEGRAMFETLLSGVLAEGGRGA